MTACRSSIHRVGPNRREVLRAGSLGLLGLGWPQLLQSQARAETSNEASFGRAKSCILLFMWGGPAHQDTWDLKPNAPVEVRGEFKPIATRVPGIQICEHLPLLAARADRLAIVRSLTHTNVDHTAATHFLLTGQPPPKGGDLSNDWPHIGSVLARLGRGVGPLPPFVSMRPKPHVENDVPRFVEESHGQFAGWLGQSYNPLTIDADPSHAGYHVGDFALPPEISLARLDDRRELLVNVNEQLRRLEQTSAAMELYYRRAFELLSSAAGGSAFKLDEEPDSVRDRYGRHPHGQSVLQARRLIERGVPLVTVYWPSEGIKNVSVYWDTHSRNFVDLKQRLMPPADQAFSALLDDLEERGLLDETLVVWTGEFGRTPKVGQRNSDAGAGADGRDHWPGCFSAVLAGGGIRGGRVIGRSDKQGGSPVDNPIHVTDLFATMYHALGVGPDTPVFEQTGRPLFVVQGKLVPSAF